MFQGRSSEPLAVATWLCNKFVKSIPPAVLVWPARSICVGHAILRCTSKRVCTRCDHISVSNGNLSHARSANQQDTEVQPTSNLKDKSYHKPSSQHFSTCLNIIAKRDPLWGKQTISMIEHCKHKGLDASYVTLYSTHTYTSYRGYQGYHWSYHFTIFWLPGHQLF